MSQNFFILRVWKDLWLADLCVKLQKQSIENFHEFNFSTSPFIPTHLIIQYWRAHTSL